MSEHAEARWRSILSEETLIPVSMVIILISGVFWIASVSGNVDFNRVETTRLTEHAHESDALLRDIANRLGRIEGKLDGLNEKRR